MGRIVILLIIAFLVWLVFRSFFRAQVRSAQPPVESRSAKGEDMVACSRCGVNLPRSEARNEGSAYFCRDNPRCIAGP